MESKQKFPPAGHPLNSTSESNCLNETTEYDEKKIVHHETGNQLKSESLSAKVIPSLAIDTNAPKLSLSNQSKFNDGKNEPKTVLFGKTKSSQPEGTEEVHNGDSSVSEDNSEEVANEKCLQLTGRSNSTISGEVTDQDTISNKNESGKEVSGTADLPRDGRKQCSSKPNSLTPSDNVAALIEQSDKDGFSTTGIPTVMLGKTFVSHQLQKTAIQNEITTHQIAWMDGSNNQSGMSINASANDMSHGKVTKKFLKDVFKNRERSKESREDDFNLSDESSYLQKVLEMEKIEFLDMRVCKVERVDATDTSFTVLFGRIVKVEKIKPYWSKEGILRGDERLMVHSILWDPDDSSNMNDVNVQFPTGDNVEKVAWMKSHSLRQLFKYLHQYCLDKKRKSKIPLAYKVDIKEYPTAVQKHLKLVVTKKTDDPREKEESCVCYNFSKNAHKELIGKNGHTNLHPIDSDMFVNVTAEEMETIYANERCYGSMNEHCICQNDGSYSFSL